MKPQPPTSIARPEETSHPGHRALACLAAGGALVILISLSACVQADPYTGKTIPRGGQRYEFSTVERRAAHLETGMSQLDVLLVLGSPAKKSDDGAIWTYLPERAGVLVPSRALRLEFHGGTLVRYGYSPIIAGKHF